MPDERLVQLALHEADGLTPQALGVLRAELERRGMSGALGSAVDAQLQVLSGRDIEGLVAAIQKQPCPACGSTDRPLNGGWIAEVKSALLFSVRHEEIDVACPDCLTKRAKRAAWLTVLFGWWAFPLGPVYTLSALRHNRRTIRQGDYNEASEALRLFVEENPGVATALAGTAS